MIDISWHGPHQVGPLAHQNLAQQAVAFEPCHDPLPACRLTPPTTLLAGLPARSQGDITRWDHPAVAAENPGVALPPGTIRVGYRATSSGSTAVVSQYLANVSASTQCRQGAPKGT